MKFDEKLSKYYKEFGLEEVFINQPTIGATASTPTTQPTIGGAPQSTTGGANTSTLTPELCAMIQKHPEYGPAQQAVDAASAKRDQIMNRIQTDLMTHIQALSAVGHPGVAQQRTTAPGVAAAPVAPNL